MIASKKINDIDSTRFQYKPTRKSFITNYVAAFVLFALLLTLSAGIDTSQASSFTLVIFMVVFIFMLILEPEKNVQENTYILTSNEVIHVKGVFAKKQTIIPYKNIGSIKITQSTLGRIFNFGDIYISGPKEDIVMKGLDSVNGVYNVLNSRIHLS